MQVDIKDLIETADLKEPLYPGKKLVKRYPQAGEFKGHCVVFDWKNSGLLKVELKAGLNGKTLEPQDLRNYPVSYQAPTFVDIDVKDANDNEKEDDEDEEEETKGKSGGGGKKPAKKLEDQTISMSAFGNVMEGQIPGLGEISKFVVMGKEIAAEAFETAFENLTTQLSQAKVMAMDLMKGVGDIIQRATPGGGLEAKGNETIDYSYDSERTAPMFGGMAPS